MIVSRGRFQARDFDRPIGLAIAPIDRYAGSDIQERIVFDEHRVIQRFARRTAPDAEHPITYLIVVGCTQRRNFGSA